MGLLDWLFRKRRQQPSRPRRNGGGHVPMYTDSGGAVGYDGGAGLGHGRLDDDRESDPHGGGDDSSSDSGNDGGIGGSDGGGGGGDGGGGD